MTKIISAKGDTFFISYNNQLIGGILTMRPVFLHPLGKCLPFPFSLAKKRIYLETHLKEELTDLF